MIYRDYSMNLGNLFDKVTYGTSKRFDCPYCKGTNTLSISKESSRVLYFCYKNSCDLHRGGSRYINLTGDELKIALASKTSLEAPTDAKREFVVPDYWIHGIGSKKAFQMLLNSNCMEAYTDRMFNVAYDPRQDRTVFLVQDETGKVIGGIGRALSGQKPKTYNYPDSLPVPFTCGYGNTAVIVEDCASACSIGRFDDYKGIALLGTHLKAEYLFHIVANYTKIIIALDPDAYSKSMSLQKSISYYTTDVKIWKIPKDLKNMTREEIQELILQNRTPIII